MPRKYLYYATAIALITAWFSAGYHQADEHFQILEFALYKAGEVGPETLPWEFPTRMRPAFQPLLAYGVYRLVGLFSTPPDPFVTTFLLRLLSVALMLTVVLGIFRRYQPAFPDPTDRRWFALLCLFSWFVLYVGVRFNSENWSGALFALGLLAYPLPARRHPAELNRKEAAGGGSALLSGLLFGLAFECRYQIAVAVLGFGAWLLLGTKPNWKNIALVITGGLLALGLGALADYWLYGDWVVAPWNYLDQNLLQGKAATFGTKPWYGYIDYIFERGVPPLSLVYLAAIGYFCYRYRRDPITWSFLAFFIIHSLLSRKDARFIYPMVYFLPIAIAVGLRDVRQRYGRGAFQHGWRKWAFRLAVFMSVVFLLAVSLRPMNAWDPPLKFAYYKYTDQPVLLFADDDHIYGHALLTRWFYAPQKGLRIIYGPRGTWPACPGGVTCLYTQETAYEDPPARGKLVYTSAPFFLEDWDAFGLLRKVRFWYLYEID